MEHHLPAVVKVIFSHFVNRSGGFSDHSIVVRTAILAAKD